MSELISHNGSSPLMGQLRCQMERRGRKSLKGYKKRFWVVNEENGTLEMYRNDQEHVPIHVFHSSDIRDVIFADDKQNHYFVMVVSTRGPYDIKFRLDSFIKREEWLKAITHIMDVYTNTNKHKNVLEMAQRRAKMVADALKVSILIESSRLLAEVSEDLLQYVVEAVDIGLASVTAIVHAFSGRGVNVVSTYVLQVYSLSEEKAASFPAGPQYNPEGRIMTLNVCLVRAMSERVRFVVTQPEEVLRLEQSNVFRNPVIEGWIENDPDCARVCAEIRYYLDVPADRHSWIMFQWGQDVNDSAKVEAFFQRFITVELFRRALQSIRNAVERVEPIMAAVRAQISVKNAAGASAAGPTGDGSASAPRRPRHCSTMFGEAPEHNQGLSFALGAMTPGLQLSPQTPDTLNGGIHSTPHSVSSSVVETTPAAAIAIQLIRHNVAGLCIQLERRVVESDATPPTIVPQMANHYDRHCRPAFLLVTKLRRVFPQAYWTINDALSDRLYMAAFNAFLQLQLSILRSELSDIFQKKVKVVIMWELLFRAAEALRVRIEICTLPLLVLHVKNICVSRLQHVAQVLRHAHSDEHSSAEDVRNMYNVFCNCVSAFVVTFLPFSARNKVCVFEPTLQAGVLTDTLYCTKEEMEASLMHALGHVRRGTSATPVRGSLRESSVGGVLLYAAEAKLGAWCEKYFSVSAHTIPASPRQFVEDEFDSDSEISVAVALQDHDFGEAVAYERSAEIGLLTMQRVVNTIYDSQCRAPVDLKIGTDDIIRAIRAFRSTLGKGTVPSKHDVARVLIVNLQRLRQMYVRAVDDETTSLLSFAQARRLLRDFCEYEENEKYIDKALRAMLPGADSTSPRDDYRSGRLSGRRSEHHEPADMDVEESNDSVSSDTGDPLRSSNAHHNGYGFGDNRRSRLNSSSAGEVESTQLLRRRCSVSRRRFSHSSQPFLDGTVASPRRTGSRNIMHISLPKSAADAFDFAAVTDVALTELLPREFRLARLAWRVGLVFGLENTGKSLIINSLRGVARPTVATVGLSQQIVAYEQWVWALHELGGRASFRRNWRYYTSRIEKVHFLIFVVDVRKKESLEEARKYLEKVAEHFHDAPLLVIFNNFHEGHRRIQSEEQEALVDLDKLRKKRHNWVLSCACDVTVVHSKNRQLPPSLSVKLHRLSEILMTEATKEGESNGERLLGVPKMVAPSGYPGTVGAGAGATTADFLPS